MKNSDKEILLPGDVMLVWANNVKNGKCPSIIVCNSSNAWICVLPEFVYTSCGKQYVMSRKSVSVAYTNDLSYVRRE